MPRAAMLSTIRSPFPKVRRTLTPPRCSGSSGQDTEGDTVARVAITGNSGSNFEVDDTRESESESSAADNRTRVHASLDLPNFRDRGRQGAVEETNNSMVRKRQCVRTRRRFQLFNGNARCYYSGMFRNAPGKTLRR